MAESEVSGSLLGSVVEFAQLFGELLAGGDPVQVVLLLLGALLIVFSSAVLGLLALGALADWVASLGPSAGAPPRRG